MIGSYARLAERWGRALPADFDPHKPHIDGYTWGCAHEGCGGTMRLTQHHARALFVEPIG